MTGYKIAAHHDGTEWKPCMVVLEIPEDAMVVRPLTVDGTLNKKLRCDKAKVVSIVDLEDRSIKLGSAVSLYVLTRCIDTAMPFYTFHKQLLISLRCIIGSVCTLPGGIYKPGEIVEPHDFSTSNNEECAPGIHFFGECTEAIRYAVASEVTSVSYPLRVCRMLNEIKVVPPKSNS